jgi:GTP-binding protein
VIDRVEIVVKAGNGGDGAISFRHEKYVPFGGPDGGAGGDGGDIIIMANSSSVSTLADYRYPRHYRAPTGGHGKGKNKHGAKGEDLVLMVPVETVVFRKAETGENEVLADLLESGQQVVVAKGGRGGLANASFASSTNQAPRIAEKGELGEEKSLILELRLIADVGIIGYPNVGKSTLLAAASAAKPKIADYPFTTLSPILGVVELVEQGFVLAEIPGLIEGAHLGRGLGHDFLRHATRTKMFIHLVGGHSPSPVEDMIKVNNELNLYDPAMSQKRQLVAVNKIDLPEVRVRLPEIESDFAAAGVRAFFISAETGEGVPEFMAETARMLSSLPQPEAGPAPVKVFRPEPMVSRPTALKQGDVFVIVAPAFERILARVGIADEGLSPEVRKQLERLGITRVLVRAGVKPGDRVRCGDFEWEWD